MKLTLKDIISLATLFSFLFGAFLFFDARYTRCERTQEDKQELSYLIRYVEWRVDHKVESDILQQTQQQKWALQGKFNDESKAPPGVKQRLLEMDAKIVEQQRKLDNLEKNKPKQP